MRKLRLILLLLLVAGAAILWRGYANATADPVLRRAELKLAGYPAEEPPMTILLISDIHVAGPDMPPARLERLVARINALRPDMVVLAGDFVSDKVFATAHYPLHEAIAPLKRLQPRLGSFAVLGNHDHWRDAVEARAALGNAGVRILDNDALQLGPVALGGMDDDYTGHKDVAGTLARLRPLTGPRLMLTHSPDPFPELKGVAVTLAGHTHCGQIALPGIGPLTYASRHGARYGCGLIKEDGRLMLVGAGVGTSILPLRYGVKPDMWLVRIGPREDAPRSTPLQTTAPRIQAP